jgi:hypothetical protein
VSGWDNGLCQDYSAKLSQWFASRLDARAIVRRWICDWTHGGGQVKRDAGGRINWQCSKCGAWADPVSPEDERASTDQAISEALKSMHVAGTCAKNEEK